MYKLKHHTITLALLLADANLSIRISHRTRLFLPWLAALGLP